MSRSNRPLPRELPEPEAITTARRNIHLPEFRKFLKESPYSITENDEYLLDRIIETLDRILENMGKGMAHVHWKHGAIQPVISVGDPNYNGEQVYGIIHDSLRSTSFPDFKPVRSRTKPKHTTLNMFTLTDHSDTQGCELMLPITDIYRTCYSRAENRSIQPEITGDSNLKLNMDETFIALGAHEAYHIYDVVYHTERFKDEFKNYQFGKDGDEHYKAHPIEMRAREAARDALAYYSKSASVTAVPTK